MSVTWHRLGVESIKKLFFMRRILSFRGVFTFFVINVVYVSIVLLLCSLYFFVVFKLSRFLAFLRSRCLRSLFIQMFHGIFLKFYFYNSFKSLHVLLCLYIIFL